MPRTKRTAKMPRGPEYQVGLDDELPEGFIQYIRAIPPSTPRQDAAADLSHDRSPKRQKLEPSSLKSVCVAKSHLSFSRKCSSSVSPIISNHQDIGTYLRFYLKPNHLYIRSQQNSKLGGFYALISPDAKTEEKNKTASRILAIAGSQPRIADPGAIWTNINMRTEQAGSTITVDLFLELFWNETITPLQLLRSTKERQTSQQLIDAFFPTTITPPTRAVWSPMDFYDAAWAPPKDSTPSIQVSDLNSSLFPYQKRTLQWLLWREGVQWSEPRDAIEPLSMEEMKLKSGINICRTVQDAFGHDLYLSDVLHTVTTDESDFRHGDLYVQGGILAEEMGLGKTLEMLALILLHKRTGIHDVSPGELQHSPLPSRATLIVAPESLRAQWISEISRHAPTLRVTHYRGCKKMGNQTEDELVHDLAQYDIVVTTYAVLSAEIHFTADPPDRPRRRERQYSRVKSPLVQISWWRVCLDEAQMIENGVSKAASVARMIPRVNAWGITGTPVKDNVDDLYGLLLFLQYQPYCFNRQAWQSLVKENKTAFQQLFRSISLRHTKSMVRDEIMLPAQRRYVISMPFTAVEEQHYQSLFKEMTEACQVSVDGAPLVDDWKPEDFEENMRLWLNRLRQTSLHPEVGIYNRRVLGQSRNRPMRTVDEVLDAMLDQSETSIRSEERAYLNFKLTRGQVYENSPRVGEALVIWEEARAETSKLVVQAREKFKEVIREDRKTTGQDDAAEGSDSDEELEGTETKGRIGEQRRRLRAALELHHKAVFFCANAYFQIRDNPEKTEPDSEEFTRLKKLEDEGYENAKVIRREILRESHRKASRLMTKIARKASEQSFAVIPELVTGSEKGIESGRTVDSLDVLYEQLNDQASILDEWREDVIQLLLRPLVDEEGDVETTGEELMDSAKMQEHLMVYVQALRAAIADRQDAISGQKNELVKHETETSIKMAEEDEGPAPEKLLELLRRRAELKPLAPISMRGAITDLRSLQTRLNRDRTDTDREVIEYEIVMRQLKSTQALLQEQNKIALALESEIESFTTAMNARLEYYRQLQIVSDAVLPLEGPANDGTAARLKQSEDDAWRKLSAAEAKHRYLLNLKETGSKSSEPRMCVICQMAFMTGVLTVCGHQFCKECITMWFKAHHNCPVCKRALKSSNLHDITLKPQQLQVRSDESSRAAREEQENQSSSTGRNDTRKKTMIYSEFNSEKLAEIKNVELDGPSFTTKVDTLVRHLLWLRESDPGAKSIIFSQYKDFLLVLQKAFKRFRIGFASIDESKGITKFKDDASTKVFLLHARAHSSGLNLVNASHVFLCEPLLNTALELQAIARVDRIGQQNETTVWLYLVSGTVEESIYNLSVKRRMEHMGKNLKGKSRATTPELLDASIDEANTLEMEHAALSKLMSKDVTAGEVVDKSDLWQCLFGHVNNQVAGPERDVRLQEKAVMGYLAGEAAEARKE